MPGESRQTKPLIDTLGSSYIDLIRCLFRSTTLRLTWNLHSHILPSHTHLRIPPSSKYTSRKCLVWPIESDLLSTILSTRVTEPHTLTCSLLRPRRIKYLPSESFVQNYAPKTFPWPKKKQTKKWLRFLGLIAPSPQLDRHCLSSAPASSGSFAIFGWFGGRMRIESMRASRKGVPNLERTTVGQEEAICTRIECINAKSEDEMRAEWRQIFGFIILIFIWAIRLRDVVYSCLMEKREPVETNGKLWEDCGWLFRMWVF